MRCNLRVSWRTQLLSLLLHGALVLLILLSPWPIELWPVWLSLLTLVVFETMHSQARIASTRGELIIVSEGDIVYWKKQVYQIQYIPLILKIGIFLYLKSHEQGKTVKLWIATDSVSCEEWRSLRRLLLQWRTSEERDNK